MILLIIHQLVLVVKTYVTRGKVLTWFGVLKFNDILAVLLYLF